MLEEGKYADITLNGQGGSVKAHQSVLINVSPVFAAMLKHDMKEKNTSTINIFTMSIDALRLFLILLYVHPSMLNMFDDVIVEHLVEISEAIEIYQVEGCLKKVLKDAWKRNLTIENCWYYYNKSYTPLIYCEKFTQDNFGEVVKSPQFLEEMKSNPKKGLQSCVGSLSTL